MYAAVSDEESSAVREKREAVEHVLSAAARFLPPAQQLLHVHEASEAASLLQLPSAEAHLVRICSFRDSFPTTKELQKNCPYKIGMLWNALCHAPVMHQICGHTGYSLVRPLSC